MAKKDRYALSTDEIKEIEDDAVYKYKVIHALKELKGVPTKVLILGVSQTFQWAIILLIVASIYLKNN